MILDDVKKFRLPLACVTLDAYDDWVIINGGNFAKCTLKSKKSALRDRSVVARGPAEHDADLRRAVQLHGLHR